MPGSDRADPRGAATPGPWRVEGEGIRALVIGADHTIVAVRHRLPKGVHEANCCLIASAPALRDALAGMVALFDATACLTGIRSECRNALQVARLALAPAEGGVA